MAREPVVVNVYDMVSMPLFLKCFSSVIKSNDCQNSNVEVTCHWFTDTCDKMWIKV